MNKIVVQEGYALPFAGVRRRRASPSLRKQQSRMKVCAKKWNASEQRGSYRAFMSRCLKTGR